MSLVSFVATFHVAHQLYMKTAPMIDLNGLKVYLHYMYCVEHIFFKNPGWTPPHSPGILTLVATKNHMVFRINQSLSTNRSGTGQMESPTSGISTGISVKITHPMLRFSPGNSWPYRDCEMFRSIKGP